MKVAIVAMIALALLAAAHRPAFAQSSNDGVAVIDITETSATIVWTTDVPSDSVVNYGTDRPLNFSASHDALVTDHSITLVSLLPGTTYLFEAVSTDSRGRVTVFDNDGKLYRFTTLLPSVVRRSFTGIVVEFDERSLTLYLHDSEDTVVILLPEGFELSTYEDRPNGSLEVGANVAILCKLEDGEWVAIMGLVKPSMPDVPIVGVVLSAEDDSVTIMDQEGATSTFSLPESVAAPISGDMVTVFSGQDGVADGMVSSSEIIERVHSYLGELVNDTTPPQTPDEGVVQQASSLIEVIKSFTAREAQIILDVLERVPLEAQEDILEAKERARKKADEIQETLEQVKAKFRLPSGRDVRQGSGPPPHSRGAWPNSQAAPEADNAAPAATPDKQGDQGLAKAEEQAPDGEAQLSFSGRIVEDIVSKLKNQNDKNKDKGKGK